MDISETISPLLGVILGGVLTGIGAHLRAGTERKRIIALALSDLLDVRHRMMALEFVLSKISSFAQIRAEQLPQFRNMFEALLPDTGLDDRYAAAVSLLAGIDPVLAFRMRSRNALPKMLATLRSLATTNNVDLAAFENLEAALRTAAAPNLDHAVTQLACSHSFVTGRKVKKLLQKPLSMPSEIDSLLSQFSGTASPTVA